MKKSKPQIAIIMGSDSDLKAMSGASQCCEEFGVNFEVKIVSAHRTPDFMNSYAKKASANGIEVIIAGAGGAAHLPGMVAAQTRLPVIGVPVTVGSLKGLDALLSIAQMPKGVPVATVAVDNSFNAGLLALRILALKNKNLAKKLEEFQKKQKLKVTKANAKLKSLQE